MSSRWIRLDTTWDQSEWMEDLTPAQRLVWVGLLCYCKAHGHDGQVRRLAPGIFASRYVTGVTRNDVTVLEEAAITGGALAIQDGEWVITGWMRYQGDPSASDRMKRYRASQSRLSPLRNERERNVTERRVTPTETETETIPPTSSDEEVPPKGAGTPLEGFLEGLGGGAELLRQRHDYHVSQEIRILQDFVTGPTADQQWRLPDGGMVSTPDRPTILDAALADFGADPGKWNARAFRRFVESSIRQHYEDSRAASGGDRLWPGGPTQTQVNRMDTAEYSALIRTPEYVEWHKSQEAAA